MKRRALISVYNKDGLEKFAKELSNLGWEIISSGGTAKILLSAGIKVMPIEEVTKNPESFDGRMKTISFQIESAILYDRKNPEHEKQAKNLGITPIEMVVCNFYAFSETVADPNVTKDEAIEMIDVGGPTMIRAAAKNYKNVIAVIDPDDYDKALKELKSGDVSEKTKEYLASKVFRTTANYDRAIDVYFSGEAREKLPNLLLGQSQELRYGENPHQKGWFYPTLYNNDAQALVSFKQLQGKEISFNNYLDADGALYAISQLGGKEPACVVVKHTNPCGVAQSKNIIDAYNRAWDGDSLAAFGGIIAVNRPVDEKLADEMLKEDRFFEVLLAPEVSSDALKIFREKENLRVLVNPALSDPHPANDPDFKKVRGGILIQEADIKEITAKDLKVATEAKPTDEQVDDLLFAWKVCRASKSNTIIIAKDKMLIGSGVGQQDRKRCCELAVSKAGERARDAVVASDAFFPFSDGPEILIKAGTSAIIQPGGSLHDQDTIDLCNQHKIPMVFTEIRSFRH